MRILVVADIHANFPALAAVRERFDACFFLGDLVEYGPHPAACIAWARQHATHAVRGNHDHGAVQNADIDGVAGFRYLTGVTRKATIATLTAADRRYLADLPTSRMVTLAGVRYLLVHASPRDPLEEYMKPDAAAWQSRLAGIKADFVLVGHTHQQYVLPVGSTTVVNPGSVGLPRDGDPRARYAIIEDGHVELKSVVYPIEETVADLLASDIEDAAKEKLTAIYRHGRFTVNGSNGHNGHANGVARHDNGIAALAPAPAGS